MSPTARPGSFPTFIGGCYVRRDLGRRSLGSAYLARQLAFNRDVVVLVMKPQWAGNASFVARFTREAYAAAQLFDHHLASILDFGEEKGLVYFTTESINGKSVGTIVREGGALELRPAVGYVLQAARGLECAHDQNMIHRDLSPEVLFIDRLGLLKIVDLGLARTPDADSAEEAVFTAKPVVGSSVTGQATLPGASIVTSGYAAPELAENPAASGVRSDIYSLGCTLYFLLTGRPAFEGKTSAEILEKQRIESIVSPDELIKSVPKSLSAVILKMVARKPEDRHAGMGEVIRDLEGIIGIPSSGAVALGDDDRAELEQNAKAWHESPSAMLRAKITIAVLGGCAGLALLCALLGSWLGTGLFASLAACTALADFAVAGLRQQTPLFQKASALVLGSTASGWLTGAAGFAVFVGLLMILKLFWIGVAIVVAAIGIALGLRVLDDHARSERREPLERIESAVRSLRGQGIDEELVRQLVCSGSGRYWEAPYEMIFGYHSLLQARDRWARNGGQVPRPRHAAWRDPLCRWIDSRLVVRQELRERAVIQKFEERGLEAQGVNLVTARRKAARAARAMVATAAEIRETIRPRDGTIMVNRSIAEAMREAALKPETVLLEHERGVWHDREAAREGPGLLAVLAGALFGPKVRFLAGALLLAGCIVWMHQNAMISAEHAGALVEAAQSGDLNAMQTHALSGVAHAREKAARPTHILELPLPPLVLEALSSFGAGAGGLILVVSSFVGGARIAYFAIPAAAIPILGSRLGLPGLAGLDSSVIPSIIGVALLGVGLVFARR